MFLNFRSRFQFSPYQLREFKMLFDHRDGCCPVLKSFDD